ncbi:MAG: lysophospholipid acyltransferase family protein [Gemmatimonadetes bacterium]|nr:lysophospholipid acyltransferase family protein [Gemmatimonadota bacterium]
MTDRGALPAPLPPPGPFAVWAFQRYVARLARRSLASVRWHALDDWQAWPPLPTLVVANHTNWWDGFLSSPLSTAMGHHFRILMEARNLARYKIFLRVGALPIERRSPTQAMRDLARATACLAPGTMVWIYPQGQRSPAAAPIADLERGAAWMIERHGGPIRVLPVAFRYPFLGEQQPECFILAGQSWVESPGASMQRAAVHGRLTEGLRATIATLDARLVSESLDDFAMLIAGRPSINTRLDAVRHRLGLLDDYDRRNG